MDNQNPSAHPRVQSRVAAKNHPNRGPRRGGLIHENTRHRANFTVIGNHLAQHPTLSGLAIGIGTYIQSLRAGAAVDIKTLATRFPEGAVRVARALRELEAEGYLRRERQRTPDGRIVSRTISCNQPGRPRDEGPDSAHAHDSGHDGGHAHDHARDQGTAPHPARPKREARAPKPLPPVPRPLHPAPKLLEMATDLVADLRRHDRRLVLSVDDAAHLVPGVAAWLERKVGPTAVRHSLLLGLPEEPLCRPAAILAHRLTARLPPPLPHRPPAPAPRVRHPLQTCEGCDRAFRAPAPGRCRDCRATGPTAT